MLTAQSCVVPAWARGRTDPKKHRSVAALGWAHVLGSPLRVTVGVAASSESQGSAT